MAEQANETWSPERWLTELLDIGFTFDQIFEQLLGYHDPRALAAAITGQRKQKLKQLIDEQERELDVDAYERTAVDANTQQIGAQLIVLLQAIDQANRPGGGDLVQLSRQLTDFLGAHKAVLDALTVRGTTLPKYLVSLTDSGEECNNVFASKAIPDIRVVLEGKPKVRQLKEWLQGLGVTGLGK